MKKSEKKKTEDRFFQNWRDVFYVNLESTVRI